MSQVFCGPGINFASHNLATADQQLHVKVVVPSLKN